MAAVVELVKQVAHSRHNSTDLVLNKCLFDDGIFLNVAAAFEVWLPLMMLPRGGE